MNKRILVIDDEDAVRESFALTLGAAGFVVDTAESGEEGLRMKGEAAYDLIFLDLAMPSMDGVKTLRKIRETDQDVLVYIFTSLDEVLMAELEIARQENLSFEVLKRPDAADMIVKISELILGLPKEVVLHSGAPR